MRGDRSPRPASDVSPVAGARLLRRSVRGLVRLGGGFTLSVAAGLGGALVVRGVFGDRSSVAALLGVVASLVVGLLLLRQGQAAHRVIDQTFRDAMDERRRLAHELVDERSSLRHVLGGAPLTLFALDADGRFTYCDGHGLESLGIRPGELVGSDVEELYGDEPSIIDPIRRALGGEERHALVQAHGRTLQITCTPTWEDGAVRGVLGVSLDVTERQRLMHAVQSSGRTDPLTGLPSRSAFIAAADDIPATVPVHVVVFDIVDFAAVNEAHGTAVGDEVLRELARRLAAEPVGASAVARLGNDEFVMLFEGEADSMVVRRVQRVRAVMQDILELGLEVPVHADLSVGLARGPAAELRQLVPDAVVACGESLRAGGAVTWFDDRMRIAAEERTVMRGELEVALTLGELEPWFQPTVDLRTGAVVGHEALARWNHPRRGVISPVVFIPVAEQTGQIVELGQQILLSACRQAEVWSRAHPDAPPWVAVNVSMQQLAPEVDLVRVVVDALDRTGLAPELLMLELTETMAMTQLDVVRETIADLARIGVRVALDDFGSGYSALSILDALDVHTLKLDRGLVVDRRRTDDVLVRSTIDLGHRLGMVTLAEGIEDDATARQLRTLGCDLGQGYLFARPMEAKDASEHLTRARAGLLPVGAWRTEH